MSEVRGDWIGLSVVFAEVGLISWCCGGLVCGRWPGIFPSILWVLVLWQLWLGAV